MDRPVQVDRDPLTRSHVRVYSGFLRHAERASATYDMDVRSILRAWSVAAAWSVARRT